MVKIQKHWRHCWQRRGGRGTLTHHWWECKVAELFCYSPASLRPIWAWEWLEEGLFSGPRLCTGTKNDFGWHSILANSTEKPGFLSENRTPSLRKDFWPLGRQARNQHLVKNDSTSWEVAAPLSFSSKMVRLIWVVKMVAEWSTRRVSQRAEGEGCIIST